MHDSMYVTALERKEVTTRKCAQTPSAASRLRVDLNGDITGLNITRRITRDFITFVKSFIVEMAVTAPGLQLHPTVDRWFSEVIDVLPCNCFQRHSLKPIRHSKAQKPK